MNGDFYIKSYSVESFVCALLLTFMSFSILPLSVSIIESRDKKSTELVKVYSRQDLVNKNKSESHKKNELPIVQISGVNVSDVHEICVAPALDFSLLKVGSPNLSADSDFSISTFGVYDGSLEGGEIMTFELDSLDKIPRRLNSVKVNYPRDLLRRGVEGEVKLNVIIDEFGDVEVESVAFSSDKKFELAAIIAASKLKYEVPTRGGKAVRARFELPIPFKILK